jgi:hypothetical protein
MFIMEMSITRGLAELKLLNDRIYKAIQSSEFAGMAIGKKPVMGFADNAEFEQKVKGNYDSVQALIKRRNAIKSAIVVSNATTNVVITGKEMTVAEAIERKTSIAYEKQLLQKLQRDYTVVMDAITRKNLDVETKLDKQLEILFGRDAKISQEQIDTVTKPYKEENEAKFIDPLKLKEKIDQLSEEIDGFLSEVDFILSESNTTTKIEIED